MFLNRFGFSYNSEVAQYSKFVFILTIVPTYYLLREVQLQKESELIINRGLNNNTKFRSTLKKYYNGNILYILNMEKINKKPFDAKTIIFLSLLDKDVFKIDTFEVGRYTYENDKNGNLKAIIMNSSHSMNLQNYNRIKHWNLLYKLKTIPQ